MNRFFIIGNPRSGTTLLRLMLNKHKDICVPPEAGFMIWLHGNGFKDFVFTKKNIKLFIYELKQTKKIESWNLNYRDLEKYLVDVKPLNYSRLCDEVYRFYCTQILNRTIVEMGDKNNFYLNYIHTLVSIYPNCRFIHIIRDGRSVAASYQKIMEKKISSKNAPRLSTDIVDIANEWKKNITTIKEQFSSLNSKNYIEVRFEDLLLKPNDILGRLTTFLGLDFDSSMLNYYETKENEGLEPKEFQAWKDKNKKPIQTEEVQKYKLLTTEDRREFEYIASKLLSEYRYF